MQPIVLIHDWLTGLRGGEKCLEVLCRRFPQARLLTLFHIPGSTSPAIERMSITTSFLQDFPGVGRYYRWLLPLMPLAVGSLSVPRQTRLVVSLSHAVAKSLRVPAGTPHVCYCFTPMRYAWVQPEQYLPTGGPWPEQLLGFLGRAVLAWLRAWDRRTANRVSHFVAISQTVADRIAAFYGRRSVVIYPPVDTEFYTPAPSAQLSCADCREDYYLEDYYLCVSALVPYKRIDLAVEACRRLGRRLVVVGEGPLRRRLEKLAGPDTELVGWAAPETLRQYYQQARALLFPALEDFGITPVEAQACGCPVIAYGQGGVTETVLPAGPDRPGTGLFFQMQTVDALCRAMLLLESHPEWFDRTLARRQAERFAAARFEKELVGYLEEVLAGRAPSDQPRCQRESHRWYPAK